MASQSTSALDLACILSFPLFCGSHLSIPHCSQPSPVLLQEGEDHYNFSGIKLLNLLSCSQALMPATLRSQPSTLGRTAPQKSNADFAADPFVREFLETGHVRFDDSEAEARTMSVSSQRQKQDCYNG